MLGVSLHPVGPALHEGRSRSLAGAGGRFLHGKEDLRHVVSVDGHPRDAVAGRLVGHRPGEALLLSRRGIGPPVVLEDEDHREPLDGGEVDPLVERPRRAAAVPDVGDPHGPEPPHPVAQEHPRQHGDHRPEHRRGRIDPQLGPGEMEDPFLAARRGGGPGQVLREDVAGRDTPGEDRSEVPDQRGEEIPLVQREGGGDGAPLLPERAVEAARELPLPVKPGEALLEEARPEHQPVREALDVGGERLHRRLRQRRGL